MEFLNKVVLITGGSRGIGAAAAVGFAKGGAHVAIVGRNQSKLREVEERCSQFGSKPLLICADLTEDQEMLIVVQKTIYKYGKLDILVNNAGILRQSNILQDSFIATYDEIMRINTRAAIHITSLALPYLIKSKGNIINVSSVASHNTSLPNFVAYKTSKAALHHFSKNIASEMAGFGVRVNLVSPGPVDTDIYDSANLKDIFEVFKNATALKNACNPDEVADLILYLASDKAKSITGTNYVIDNGLLIK